MAQGVVEFVMVRFVVPAVVLGAIGGIFYGIERCSAHDSDDQPTPAQSAAKHRDPSDAATARGDGGLSAAQRARLREAIARFDGSFRYRPTPRPSVSPR